MFEDCVAQRGSRDASAQTTFEQSAVAIQAAGLQNYNSAESQTVCNLGTVGTQTVADSRCNVLEHVDAIRSQREMLVCGCPTTIPPQKCRHDLMIIPAGEVGIVKLHMMTRR